jgi:hypothetical protein
MKIIALVAAKSRRVWRFSALSTRLENEEGRHADTGEIGGGGGGGLCVCVSRATPTSPPRIFPLISPLTYTTHTSPTQQTKDEVVIDLDAATTGIEGAAAEEEEDVALVDEAVLAEEEKLREQRRKAEEANKKEVRASIDAIARAIHFLRLSLFPLVSSLFPSGEVPSFPSRFRLAYGVVRTVYVTFGVCCHRGWGDVDGSASDSVARLLSGDARGANCLFQDLTAESVFCGVARFCVSRHPPLYPEVPPPPPPPRVYAARRKRGHAEVSKHRRRRNHHVSTLTLSPPTPLLSPHPLSIYHSPTQN